MVANGPGCVKSRRDVYDSFLKSAGGSDGCQALWKGLTGANRSKALWVLGYPEAALMDIDQALTDARESGHAVSLVWELTGSFFFVESYCGNYTTANARVDELIALADEKDVLLWKAFGMLGRGWLLGLTGRASDGVQMITSGITAWRATGSTFFLPTWLSYLA